MRKFDDEYTSDCVKFKSVRDGMVKMLASLHQRRPISKANLVVDQRVPAPAMKVEWKQTTDFKKDDRLLKFISLKWFSQMLMNTNYAGSELGQMSGSDEEEIEESDEDESAESDDDESEEEEDK